MKSNYNKFPSTKIKGHEHAAVVGYNNILDTLKKEIPSGKYVMCIRGCGMRKSLRS